MTIALKGMYLFDRDIELLPYLHAVKVATYEQIKRDIYSNICLHAVGNRLRKLHSNRLVRIEINRTYKQGRCHVSLLKQGFDGFVKKGTELRLELRSDALQHDLSLVDIRHCFKQSSQTVRYQTENEIQTWEDGFRAINSDALVTSNLNGNTIAIPIEYESSLKKADRYEPFLKKYYLAEEYPIVILIADQRGVMNTIIELEKQLFNWDKPKFFYRLKQDLFADDALRFQNCHEATLDLGYRLPIVCLSSTIS